MKARLQRIWRSAHRGRVLRAAVLLGVALAVGSGGVGAQWLRLARQSQVLDSEQAAQQAAAAESDALRVLGEGLGEREARVRMLRERGFVRSADRVAWAEAATAAIDALRPLRYEVEVGAEAPLPLPSDVQAWYDQHGLAAPRLVANELRLEVEGLHEEELLAVIERARTSGGGVVRVERCRLDRRADAGVLGAECILRRFALLATSAAETGT